MICSNLSEDTVKILESITALLGRCNANVQAEIAGEARNLLVANEPKAIELLTGPDFWGGSGSLLDLYICNENGHISEHFDRDNQELTALLRQLIVNLRKSGYDRPSFDEIEQFLSRKS